MGRQVDLPLRAPGYRGRRAQQAEVDHVAIVGVQEGGGACDVCPLGWRGGPSHPEADFCRLRFR